MSEENNGAPASIASVLGTASPAAALNREGWLTEVSRLLAPLFPCGLAGKKYRITCGWPSVSGLSPKARRLGECHAHESSKDGTFELFVSPVLDNPIEVAGTVAHELAHVAAGVKAGHGSVFVAVCKAIGLTAGRAKSAGPGLLLKEKIRRLIDKLPRYPHAALVPITRTRAARGGPICLVCEDSDCGCRITMAERWFDVIPDMPTCGCGSQFVRK